ncbi:MAG: NADH-quinone oxidoreductase subunit L [Planctomycetota bacterium]|nr:MAG: NADH-quinone oxidoreductase subunit L [Planctomycetota bacterium]
MILSIASAAITSAVLSSSSADPIAVATLIKPAIASPELAWAGLILCFPALAAVLCAVCGAMRVKSKLPGMITAIALIAAFVTTLSLYLTCHDGATTTARTIHLFDWITFAWRGESGDWTNFLAPFTLYVDSLTLLWMLFVTGLGSLITIYATEYMEEDQGKGYVRFFGGISVFLFAMGTLVLGGNLLLLYLGWEGVGLASYLLVGYNYDRPSAVAAAKKAFIVNRVGDLGLAFGIFLIWLNYGTIEYDALFQALADTTSSAGTTAANASEWSKAAIPYLLMLGAFGKSAQFPLHVWLPDAMEGPTPVSALIHAATMVTAGVYLIARTYPLFELQPLALPVVACIGCFSALLAASIGMAQYDIKRVMAYSTISQLGYMFLGLGVGSTFGASYHVFTHAFFKALLFLCCGAIMHGMGGQLDLRKLSGLRHVKGFRVTSWTLLIGCICLSGFPFSSGFYSKDTIIGAAFASDDPLFIFLGWVAIVTAGMTAYYAFRVWFRVCCGEVLFEPDLAAHAAPTANDAHGHVPPGVHMDLQGGHAAHDFHPHGPRFAINGVLLVIAVGAILAALPSYLAEFAHQQNWIQSMVTDSSAVAGAGSSAHDAHAEHANHALSFTGISDIHTATSVVASAVGILGICIAAFFHLTNRKAADRLRHALLSNALTRWLPLAMENKWYVDEIYHVVLRLPAWAIGHVLHFSDAHVIDGFLVNGTARIPLHVARVFQPLYNGALQGYASTMAGGVALISAWVFWIWLQAG